MEKERTSVLSSYFAQESTFDDPFDEVTSVDGNKMPAQLSHKESSPTVETKASDICANSCVQSGPILDASTLNSLRQRDAWLPFDQINYSPNQFVNQKDANSLCPTLIRPKLFTNNYGQNINASTHFDSYCSILNQYLDEMKLSNIFCRTPCLSQTSQELHELKELIINGWYGAALNLTYQLLSGYGFADNNSTDLTPLTSQIWLTRFALLMRVHSYEIAELEFNGFQSLNSENIYYENHPMLYPGRKGSIIPFSLRLLHAELPFHLNRSREALDRLFYLLAVVGKMRQNLMEGLVEDGTCPAPEPTYTEVSLNLWLNREMRILSSCLLILLNELDYQSSIEIVFRMAKLYPNQPAVVRGLASILGRIYLQLGDLEIAKLYFDKSVSTAQCDVRNNATLLVQKTFQDALLCLAKSEYEEAKKLFQQVLRIDPTNVAAANNAAVCGLYLGQLSESLTTLEALTTVGLSSQITNFISQLNVSPTLYPHQNQHSLSTKDWQSCLHVHDAMIFNLSVLYEVESDSAIRKKLSLLRHIVKLPGEPVHFSAFKLLAKKS